MYESTSMGDMELLIENISEELDRAIAQKEIMPVYQAVIRTYTESLIGFELLARWNHPKYGMLHPREFIGILEEKHLIHKLDLYMYETGLRGYREALDRGNMVGCFVLNVSPEDLRQECFVTQIFAITERYQISSNQIFFDITARSMADIDDVVRASLMQLKAEGFHIWLDQFGKTTTSFDVLTEGIFEGIKFDVCDIRLSNPQDMHIIKGLVYVAKKMGLNTLARSVQTGEEYEFLKEIGCTASQGKFFGDPVPRSQILDFFRIHGYHPETPSDREYIEHMISVDFVTDRSLAIGEMKDDRFSYLYVNSHYGQVLHSVGIWDPYHLERSNRYSSLGFQSKFKTFTEQLVAGGQTQPFYYTIGGQNVRMLTKVICRTEERTLLELEMTNLSVERELDIIGGMELGAPGNESAENLITVISEAMRPAMYEPDPDKSLESLMNYLGNVMHSDRAYVFEEQEAGYLNNTYEWCREGVSPQKDTLQMVPRGVVGIWYEKFESDTFVMIEDIEQIKDSDPLAYEYLYPQDITSIIVSPLNDGEKNFGFFGFDNPDSDWMESVHPILRSLGSFITSLIQRRILIEQDKKKETELYLKAISSSYSQMVICNLTRNTYEYLVHGSFLHYPISPKGVYEDFVEKVVASCITPEEGEKTRKIRERNYLIDRYESGQNFVEEVHEVLDAYGAVHWASDRFMVTKDEASGDYIAVMLSNLVDQTVQEQQKHEAELKQALESANIANQTKSLFLSNMSHDIRTPMNAVLGYANIAKAHQDNQAFVEECIDKILMAGGHLQELINDVLDMSRVESGKETLTMTDCSLRQLEKEIHSIVDLQFAEKGIAFYIDDRWVEHTWFRTDSQKLRRIILNVLSNALKFTEEDGQVELSIAESASSQPNERLYTIRVSDDGLGMSPEFQEHIFETFSRERTSTASKLSGTGLGMAIVKKYVELLGGNIRVDSTQGQGTTVTIQLPMEYLADQKEESELQRTEKKQVFTEHSLEHMKILLVDDSEMNSEIATMILEDMGAVVQSASNGAEAVEIMERCQDQEFDVVLMDVQMPVMNGLIATQKIRESKRQYLQEVPIIALTANAFKEDEERCLEAGMNGHIAKPFEIEKLVDAINSIG